MRKEEYILKYGEEAYKKHLEYYKEYREKNKEKAKEYYLENKDRIIERVREYKEKNKDKIREKNREYIEKNKDRIREKNREYRRTVVGRLKRLSPAYNSDDKQRGFDTSNNVSGSWIARYIIGKQCIYCGDNNVEHLGLDRIDNTKPHTKDNVVCSCLSCNRTRGNRYTVDEFIEIMKDKRKT